MNSIRIVLLVLMTFIAGAACPHPAWADLQEILDREKLVVAMVDDLYPFCYELKSGELVGADVDMAKNIAGKLGVKLVIDRKSMRQQDIVDKVLRDEADLAISGLTVFLPNAMKVSYTNPYLTVDYSILVNRMRLAALKKSGPPFERIRSSCCEIGMLNNPFLMEQVKDIFPKAKIITYEKLDELVEATLNGEVTAAFCDEIQGKSRFINNPVMGIDLMYVQLRDQKDSLGFAVSWKSRHFRSWLNLFLDNYPLQKNVDRLLEEYPLPK